VIAPLLFVLAVQQADRPPDVMLAIDRDRVAPGDVITLTIRVASRQSDPIRVDLPSLGGFELESRSERNDVSSGATPSRTTTIQLRLRATTSGEWRLGPVNVRQGVSYAQGDPVTVTIEGGVPPPVSVGISPRLERLLQRAPPPDLLGQAGITVALSDSDVPVGEQVDVVTIAWFERGLRQQLRRAPTVEAPRIDGVWTYPQPVPGGIAATREVGGNWYDLFVLHQIVFPLTPGRVAVSPARLQYSVPLAYQFFSQEEAYKLESQPQSIVARPLPDEGREPTFAGAVGRNLNVSQSVAPAVGRQGEAFTADIVVRGEGNVALWPKPDVRWPPAFRVYPDAATEELMMRNGRLGGAKRFRFLLVADSAGTIGLLGVRVQYFDLASGRYQITTGSGPLVVIAPRGEAMASRAEPPPIRLVHERPPALALRESVPGFVWLLVALGPVLAVVLPRMPRRRRSPQEAAGSDDPLRRVEQRLAATLVKGRLPPADAAVLRKLRDGLQSVRFSPAGRTGAMALVAEAEAALARVTSHGENGQRRWRRRTGAIGVLLAIGMGSLEAQTQPEQYYEAGAYRSAEAGFRARAMASPSTTTHWFNLGTAAYRAGDDAAALVAWVRAGRLSPRDGAIRRALLLVPPSDAGATAALWIAPLTPAELWLMGLVAWLTGWGGVLWSRRWGGRWLVLLAGGLALAGLGQALERWYAKPFAFATVNQQLRLSPHELAPAVGEVPRLGLLVLGPARGGWIRVENGSAQRGWIPRHVVEPLSGSGAP
jgi:hypothetical protein